MWDAGSPLLLGEVVELIKPMLSLCLLHHGFCFAWLEMGLISRNAIQISFYWKLKENKKRWLFYMYYKLYQIQELLNMQTIHFDLTISDR